MKKTLISSALLIALTHGAQAKTTPFQAQRNAERPNIILIAAEDMNTRLGVYGDKIAKTPHLDALAKEGVTFTQAFTMAGVSSPSRAGLITGVFSHQIGLQHMRTASRPAGGYVGVPPAEIKGYPELLRRAGYFTYNDVKTDYQFSNGFTDPGPFSLWSKNGTYSNFDDLLVPAAWRNFDLQDKPFFINLNPQITHESALFTHESAPAEFASMVDLWRKVREKYHYKPTDPATVNIASYWRDTPETRKELAIHYDNIQIMDQQVGDIIKKLKQDKLWDNTIVIFTADNGDGLPRHKREGYDSGTHVPLIIYMPQKYQPAHWKKPGEYDDRLVSFEDLAPTILGMASVAAPTYMQGINLIQPDAPQREYVYASRGRMDEANMRSWFIRSHKYQYVRNMDSTPGGTSIAFRNGLGITQALNQANAAHQLSAEQSSWFALRPKEELYDLSSDPAQTHNVADNPRYLAVLQQLREEMSRWRNGGNDMNLVDEDRMVADLLDEQGQQRVTLAPVVVQDEVDGKIYIANRTDNASIGYSFDGVNWELYNGSFTPPPNGKRLQVKAVRYGWKESPLVSINLHKGDN
ncbi:arylsulfatase A-like enzyme [Pantoea alhagi]|uniref:sulfatase family protein n=1 Tax=Mixta sp. BE291 TaxID=3158787 RepID=UPI00285586B7|nr:arylsulfatase A-like enzyme [Pantoea alhagi]